MTINKAARVAWGVVILLAVLVCALLAGKPALAPDTLRIAGAAAVLAAYAAFCAGVYFRRRALQPPAYAVGTGSDGEAPTLIAYASQTGFAEQLAMQTAATLQKAGTPVTLAPLARLDAQALGSVRRALFVVSTTGEGDAPDGAAGFARKLMGGTLALPALDYGVLALGDRGYAQYCAFGHALDNWLHRQGAKPLFDIVEVDDGDPDALRHWQQYLGVLSGSTEIADWVAPDYHRWRLADRRRLNPGSPGGAAFHVELMPLADPLEWQAGDIVEIGPRHGPAAVAAAMARLALADDPLRQDDGESAPASVALATRLLPHDDAGVASLVGLSAAQVYQALPPLPHREYSIASVPADGSLQLLIRQTQYPDGRLGLGSGWLTAHAPVGAEIALRIRTNRGFHAPVDDAPLILIGNGTGLAGLRAHLKARAAQGRRRNWLLFGERTSAHDFFYKDEIEAWHRGGVLTRLDLAFSREAGPCRYVQDCVTQAAEPLRQWVADGAAIYVCGSLQGMAAGVAAALGEILGAEVLERMAEDGRYRRDVY